MITYAQRMDAVKAENARLRPADASTNFEAWSEWMRGCDARFRAAEKAHRDAHYEWARRFAA